MQEIRRRKAIAVELRARFPLVVRVAALCVLVAGTIFVGVSYYKLRNNKPFMMIGRTPELSKEVMARVEDYERRVMDGDHLRLLVKAKFDTTYSDGHHELEEVHLESYPANSQKPDQITARRAIWNQETQEVSFSGDVNVETHDALKAKTESILYNQKTEIAETKELVNFERENISGQATGVVIDSKNKRMEMQNAVEITVVPQAKEGSKVNPARSKPVTMRAARATFDQASMHMEFTGGATVEQERDIMSGDLIAATFNQQKHVEKVDARGNAYLRTMETGRAAEVHAVNIEFYFDADQRLKDAVATDDVKARSLDADSDMELTGAKMLQVHFDQLGERSLLREMKTDGRSVITLSAPKSRVNDPRAANKRLTADNVHLYWHANGRDLERAEVVGNAELVVEPVRQNPKASRRTLTAPRFDCSFYETDNLANTFVASGGAKAVFDPLQPTETSGQQTITADKMTAVFTRDTQAIDRINADGDAKFNEKDRNGHANSMAYTASDNQVRLRGGEPTVWDSRARLKAAEIDYDTENHTTNTRGKTTTTYYSQEQTGGATPFQKVKSPVYVVSDRAEFQHETGVATYTGDARAWQDDNFVRGDRLVIYRDTKRMEAMGRVQSALYQARRKNADGTRSVVPVFATAERMTYSDPDRLIHYENNVDIKQGTDRLQSAVADIYLLKDTNEVEKSIVQNNVVVTQPGRVGRGDWAQYTAADESVVLKGNPAHVEDADKGSTEGGRLTVYLRENRVIADDPRGAQSLGRVHSTHKVNKKP